MTAAPDWWLTQSHHSQSLHSPGNTTGTLLSRCLVIARMSIIRSQSRSARQAKAGSARCSWETPGMTDAGQVRSQQPCQQRARVRTPYVKARGQIILLCAAGGRRGSHARMPSSESTASPGHAEECSAPAESSVHQHTEGHTSDDRQGEPAGDHRQVRPDRWARPRQAAYLGGRHGGKREEQAGGQSAAWSAASAASRLASRIAHGESQQTRSLRAGGCGFRESMGRFTITVQ